MKFPNTTTKTSIITPQLPVKGNPIKC